ncbi:hypothetical protein [Motiliproteus sediminis]|uniref:hypothetical protein n=1 Tax=Motiliproteus sediminis TaxID=1468178 RepID=UPI001AEF867C|nr:hypothetical protein [Motiliproteus sediminis]
MKARSSSPLALLFSHLLVACVAAFAGAQLLAPTQPPAEPAPAASPSPAEPPLFQVGERQYSYHDLPIEYRRPLYQIRKLSFEQQMLLIEEAVVEAYIQQQMAAQNRDRMSIQNQLMPGAAPSEEEIAAFYAENQSLSSPPLEQIRDEVRTYLTAARQEELKRSLLTRLLVEGKARMLTEAPRLERAPSQPES